MADMALEKPAALAGAESANADAAFVRAVEKSRAEALEELAELDDYADEIDFPKPTSAAKQMARQIADKLCAAVPRYYSFAPWEGGGVVCQYNGAKGYGVTIYCDHDGGASLFVMHPGGCVYRHRCEHSEEMPLGDIINALKEIPE